MDIVDYFFAGMICVCILFTTIWGVIWISSMIYLDFGLRWIRVCNHKFRFLDVLEGKNVSENGKVEYCDKCGKIRGNMKM